MDRLDVNRWGWLLAKGRESVPSRAIVAAGVMEPLRVKDESSIWKFNRHLVTMGTFLAGYAGIGQLVSIGGGSIGRGPVCNGHNES